MTWKILQLESTSDHFKFGITNTTGRLAFHQVLDLLRSSSEFIQFYNHALSSCGFDAFFWEHPPVTQKNLDQPYECNLINSTFLAGTAPDPKTFSQYFQDEKEAVAFMNLGGDAELIVPCPPKNQPGFAHIGSFVRNASKKQTERFWKLTAERMHASISNQPAWLSTSGLGVFWLHARIDSRPKYYQTAEYKQV